MVVSRLLSPILRSKFSQEIVKSITPNQINPSGNDYTPVYTFPHIRSLAVINKAKIYQTMGTCIALPATYALSVAELCSHEMFLGIAAMGVTGCALFYMLGSVTSNTVLLLHLHKNNQTAKISYMDAWGSHRDTVIDLKEIVPINQQPFALTDPLYLSMQKYAGSRKLKLNVKYGEVLDSHKFAQIINKN